MNRYLIRVGLAVFLSSCAHVERQGQDATRAISAIPQSDIIYVPGSSQKLCQIIGQTDYQTSNPTENKTESEAGIVGTDLGFSFEHDGKLFFLFGDTDPVKGLIREKDADSIATSGLRLSSDNCIRLDFIKDPKDGGYHPPRIPHIANGGYDVPAGGMSANGKMFVYFTTGHSLKKLMGRSVLGVSTDDGVTFSKVYDNSSDHFINVDPVKVTTPLSQILLFGSGDYRQSNPYLSVSSEKEIETKGAIKYFAGLDSRTQKPEWSASESDAKALFDQPCLGEFSTIHDEVMGKWIMLYNCHADGIEMRTADEPWGPWTDPQVIFEPVRDGAIGKYVGKDVPAAGGVYGPFMIPNLFETHGSVRTIYFTVSTWVPYAVILMKADLRFTSSYQK
jgi:hypothetical protein